MSRLEVKIRPRPRWNVQPLRKTSPPANQPVNTTSSGFGISKYSPYISSTGMSSCGGSPCAIGCDGAVTKGARGLHASSAVSCLSPSADALSSRDVRRGVRSSPFPEGHAFVRAAPPRPKTLRVPCAPVDQNICLREHLLRQSVLWLRQCRSAKPQIFILFDKKSAMHSWIPSG